MLAYHVATWWGTLPTTKTYKRLGQRLYYVKAPGVLSFDASGNAVRTCLCDVDILQEKGRQTDHEAYHVQEFDGSDPSLDVRNLPRDQYGRPAQAGYLFVCFTSDPTPERPGIYRVACDAEGVAYWCSCLGARGHKQDSDCKHRATLTDLAAQAPVERPAQPKERSSVRNVAA